MLFRGFFCFRSSVLKPTVTLSADIHCADVKSELAVADGRHVIQSDEGSAVTQDETVLDVSADLRTSTVFLRATAGRAKRVLAIVILSVRLPVRHDPVPISSTDEIETPGFYHMIA